jgi:hypothetical protein
MSTVQPGAEDPAVESSFEFEPADYPGGKPLAEPSLLIDGRLRSMRIEPWSRAGKYRVRNHDGKGSSTWSRLNQVLLAENVAPIDARVLVVAVGSNAVPDVLLSKLNDKGLDPIIPMSPCLVSNIAIGHSAHVSERGYFAAAPYADTALGEPTKMVIAWLAAKQVAALSDTEPNYELCRVDAEAYPLVVARSCDEDLEALERPAGYHLYVSKHGVIAQNGRPVASMSQAGLHQVIAALPGLESVSVPWNSTPNAVQQLADDEVQREIRNRLVEHAVPDGIACERATAFTPYGDTPDRRWIGGETLPVIPSPDTLSREGEQCVALNPATISKLGLEGRHAEIQRGDGGARPPGVIVRVVPLADIREGELAADQVVRNALGVELQEPTRLIEARLASATTREKPIIRWLGRVLGVRPRYIMCRVQAADVAIVEQRACLLSPLAISRLGIADGHTVIIEGPPLRSGENGENGDIVAAVAVPAYATPDEVSARRAELSGGGDNARFPAATEVHAVFPDLPWVFLDKSLRQSLGLRDSRLGAVRIRASLKDEVSREFRELALLLLLGFLGLATVVKNAWVIVGVLIVLVVGAAALVRVRLVHRLRD